MGFVMSWKIEIETPYGSGWKRYNDICFADQEQAQAYVRDLSMKWTKNVTRYRVVESKDPAKYSWSIEEGLTIAPQRKRAPCVEQQQDIRGIWASARAWLAQKRKKTLP